GYLGSGSQYWSWIAIEDAVRAISFCLEQSLTGPVNIVGPAPVTNREFSQSLAKAMKRPCLFPAPAFALRLLLGEFADEGLLASTRVLPKKLEEAGFRFNNSELRSALTSALIQED
ncbi:MAG: DUF1731 domain-containing protein, partial [Bdellovibrionales bacterium]|nr:DUF1731 domain-containing protein [Bdellovibrionales bacterium]